MKIEYCIKPANGSDGLRFIATRCEEYGDAAAITQIGGEFATPEQAFDAAYAACKEEHERLGWPAGDERIEYPQPIKMPR